MTVVKRHSKMCMEWTKDDTSTDGDNGHWVQTGVMVRKIIPSHHKFGLSQLVMMAYMLLTFSLLISVVRHSRRSFHSSTAVRIDRIMRRNRQNRIGYGPSLKIALQFEM